MVVMDLSKDIRGKMNNVLRQIARLRPFCPMYEMDIDFNGARYTVFMHVDKKLYVLYAVQTIGSGREMHHEVITDHGILSALASLIVYQSKEMIG